MNKIDMKALAVTGAVVIVALGVFKFVLEPMIAKKVNKTAVVTPQVVAAS